MEKEKPYSKRNKDMYTQVHLHVPIDLNDRLGECASREGLTRAAWVSSILTKVIDNDGKVTEARFDTSDIESKIVDMNKSIEELSKKVDSLINITSVLIAQSSAK